MKARVILLLVTTLSAAWSQPSADENATALLHRALAAMGGEQKVRDLKTIHFTAVGHRNFLEQSERPEGPYIVDYQRIEEWRDLEHDSWRQEIKTRNVLEEGGSTVIASRDAAAQKSGSAETAATGDELQEARETLMFSPERILLLALARADLKRLPDLLLQDVPHNVVEFTSNRTPVRVYLNHESGLPTAVEWTSAYPRGIFWSVWGDITTRAYYSFWWLQDGIHYPLQIDVFRNGFPDRTAAITKLELNSAFPPDTFAISPQIHDAFAGNAATTVDDRSPVSKPPQEPAAGIVIFGGAWNTTIVRQADGIVVLEAPISSGYSAKLIAESQRRFPGVPIKAVITTSDAWPHIGGIREYVARGIPVFAPQRNVPLLKRFITAPRSRYPDALARSPRQADLRPVRGKMLLGSGPNRLEIFPLGGETTERQMMVYFPEHKLLYGSDAFQKLQSGKYFIPQTVSEVAAAVDREHLGVENFFMMHMGVTAWQDALRALQNPQ